MTLKYFPNCCYYPTTLLMVDDNPDLLFDLSLALSPQYKSKYSISPQEIVTWLSQQGNTIETLIKPWVSTPEEHYDLTKTLVNINISELHQQIYTKPPRFDKYLVLIADYAMPGMNGLKLAEKVRRELQLPVKIIMLTGEADQSTAISAFNDKLIDRFVVKSAPDYIEKLLAYVQELHSEYFKEISNLVLGSSGSGQKTVRHDPEFVTLFNEIMQRHQAVEYYLIEEPASFLFLDEKKNPVWLIVKTDEDMQVSYELARDDDDSPPELVAALKERQKLVYFPDEKSKLSPAKHWRLQNAKPLPGNSKSYYAIVEGIKDYPLKIKEIISYEQFLNA